MSKEGSLYNAALERLHHYLCGFVPLTKAEFNVILPYIEIREFDKKQKITREGEVERYLNIIARGVARKYMVIKNEEVVLQLASEGHIVHSELSFHYRTPSLSITETIEPTTLLSMTHESLQQLYDQFPKAERLGRLMISDLFIKKDSRYFDQLKKSTRERFLEYVRSHPHMLQRVPQKYIASYLNIKPETFSRLKHFMRPKKTPPAL